MGVGKGAFFFFFPFSLVGGRFQRQGMQKANWNVDLPEAHHSLFSLTHSFSVTVPDLGRSFVLDHWLFSYAGFWIRPIRRVGRC